ncbi:MAG: pyridoxal phosphate-dependent aminotransferase [Clostridia bacterium]|nr:pyridoxal phosphate-dependent aminotransferase [Clostridia bacterium]
MKYNFDEIIDRRGTDCYKWDVKDNELPMWIADMDFRTAPEVISELQDRVSHGIYGYSLVPDEWYDAYISWWERRHGFTICREWLMFCTGVVAAISSSVRKLGSPNENVVIQTPVYNIFFNSILNNGLRVLESPLVYKSGEYSMDLEDLERKFSDPQTSIFILCNPHNPVGKIWDTETLAAIGEIALRHNVTVISDEIHCDITKPGTEYIPFASVSETCAKVSVNCVAPTKTFNLAGIQTAAIYVPDKFLRHKIMRAINTDEVAEPNVFACPAAIAAYGKGEEWLDEMRQYVFENKSIVTDYVRARIPALSVVDSEATYLMWIDVSGSGLDSSAFVKELRKSTGLFLSDGIVYGSKGAAFLRMNVACPRSYVTDALERLKRFADSLSA